MRSEGIVIVEVDNVIADNSLRVAQSLTGSGKPDLSVLYDPRLVAKDVPMEAEFYKIVELSIKNQIYYLTSRETSVQLATEEWLRFYQFPFAEKIGHVLSRPKYQNAAVWKAVQVTQLSLKLQNVRLFVDHEEESRQAVQSLEIPNLRVCRSLLDL